MRRSVDTPLVGLLGLLLVAMFGMRWSRRKAPPVVVDTAPPAQPPLARLARNAAPREMHGAWRVDAQFLPAAHALDFVVIGSTGTLREMRRLVCFGVPVSKLSLSVLQGPDGSKPIILHEMPEYGGIWMFEPDEFIKWAVDYRQSPAGFGSKVEIVSSKFALPPSIE